MHWLSQFFEAKFCTLRKKDKDYLHQSRLHFFRRTAGYTLFCHKTNEEMLGESKVELVDEKRRRYKSNWQRHVGRGRMDNRMPKLMPNYGSNGRRRFGRPLKGLLYNPTREECQISVDSSTCYSRSNSKKSPGSGAVKVSKPSLISQAGTVREVVCAGDQCVSAVRAVEVPLLVCLRSSCNHVTEVDSRWKLLCKMTETLWM
jgi:hypothetical protein